MRWWGHLLKANRGGVAINTALLIAPLFGTIVCAIGFQQINSHNQRVQTQLDIAAIAAAQVFIDLYAENDADKQTEAEARVAAIEAQLQQSSKLMEGVQFSVALDQKERLATTTASGAFRILPRDMDVKVSRQSTARADFKSQPICILALEPKRNALTFAGRGEVKAKDCVIWSNSIGLQSIKFQGKGKIKSERLCTVGRAENPGQYKVEPSAEQGCQFVPDPMTSWSPPTYGACDHVDYKEVKFGAVVLRPGVYCGGLTLRAKKVILKPGTYIIRDGPLRLLSRKSVKGEDIGIFLTGANTSVEIESDAKIDITSMETGAMAGIAIAHDPANTDRLNSTISGRTDLKVGGVLYLPGHDLTYWGESDTTAASPVTTIIARTIKIGGKAYLEVKNDKDKAKYAPVLETGHGDVVLVE